MVQCIIGERLWGRALPSKFNVLFSTYFGGGKEPADELSLNKAI